jgi:branched-chain amino acid transport system substrate-binding protein
MLSIDTRPIRALAAAILAMGLAFSLGSCSRAPDPRDPVKIGMSLGLTGYVASIDRGWRDGVLLAVKVVNDRGGINGRPIEVITADNKSTPQEAVTATQRLISQDEVVMLANGCLSAGNLATIPIAARSKLPMLVCTPIPASVSPANRKWMFSSFAPVAFDVANHIAFLKSKGVRSIGILKDPTPSQKLYSDAAVRLAAQNGIRVVGIEDYKQNDADLSVQIGNLYSRSAGAILKYGAGPSNLVAARNIKQLGLPLYMVVNVQDGTLFREIAEILGEKFGFGVMPTQAPAGLPAGELKDKAGAFLRSWNTAYPGRDPGAGSRGWDSVMLISDVLRRAKGRDGSAVKTALEGTRRFVGSAAVYSFTADNHTGVQENPYSMAQFANGQIQIVNLRNRSE